MFQNIIINNNKYQYKIKHFFDLFYNFINSLAINYIDYYYIFISKEKMPSNFTTSFIIEILYIYIYNIIEI